MPSLTKETVAEATLGGLLQSGILKRFESCWRACLATVERMVSAHDLFLAALDQGVVPSGASLRDALREVEGAGVAATVDELLVAEESRPLSEFRPEYRDHVVADRDLLIRIRDRLRVLDAESDPKLTKLRMLLEERAPHKIAVFATYADTIRYLEQHLPASVGGRSRVVVIGTETDPDTRMGALARFSPRTVVRDDYVPPDGEVDLLLSTDVLSEGQNLQQADAVISYDMPWNPQRVVQRNGRVIRLKSPHTDVTLTTMLPVDGELERFLRLEATIRRKILAASLYGMETEVIEGLAAVGERELTAFAARIVDGDRHSSTPMATTRPPAASQAKRCARTYCAPRRKASSIGCALSHGESAQSSDKAPASRREELLASSLRAALSKAFDTGASCHQPEQGWSTPSRDVAPYRSGAVGARR